MASKLDPELYKRIVQEFPLMFLEMLPSQERFIRVKNGSGRTPRRRLYEAGNKNGKCITYDSCVDTPNGKIPVGKLFELGKSFDVYAWDGADKVVAKASAPFKKTVSPCYCLSFSDGTFVGVADYHRVLTDKGWLFSRHLYESALDQMESTSVASLSVLPSGVVHLSERQLSFLSGCLEDRRLCGGQPHYVGENVEDGFPLSVDVQGRNPSVSKMDVADSRYTSTPYKEYVHLSSWCVPLRLAGQFFESLAQVAYRLFQWLQYEPRWFPQLSIAGVGQLQSYGVFLEDLGQLGSGVFSYQPPKVGNKIVSCNSIPCQAVYDFTVEKYHNYFAGGLIHHNTEIGVAEDLAHALGYRPWLDEDDPDYKIPIKVPNIGLVCGETVMHSIAEKIEPTFRRLAPKHAKPVWKPGPTGVLMKLTLTIDPKTGKKLGSQIYFRSYDQRPETFEGIDFDWIHWDEPPPEEHLKAAERGKVVTNAPSWFTMTPLKEAYLWDQFSSKAAIVI